MNGLGIYFQGLQISSAAGRPQLAGQTSNRLPNRMFNKSFPFVQAGEEIPPLAWIRQASDNAFDVLLRVMAQPMKPVAHQPDVVVFAILYFPQLGVHTLVFFRAELRGLQFLNRIQAL